MKIGIFSDLHIHRHDRGHDEFIDKLIGRINSFIGLDVLICAGDLSHNIDDIDNFLRAIRLDVPKYFCPGNHDLWQAAADRPFCESDSPEYRYNDLLPKIAVKNNFYYVPSGIYSIGKFSLLGNIGWFSGSAGCYGEWFGREVKDSDLENDRLAMYMALDLERKLAAVKDNVIIVTHHVSMRSFLTAAEISPAGGIINNLVNDIILKFAHKIRLVIFGHKHRVRRRIKIGDIECVSHPLGYPGQYQDLDDGLKVIDIF